MKPGADDSAASTPSGGFAIPVPWREEAARLAALRAYGDYDPLADAEFDAVVREAARVCGTPIALVSMVDADRQWFRAQVGLEVNETPREVSFCAHAIHHSDLFVVEDAATDDRFRANPLVEGDPEIRFYAGMPLISPEGYPLGTLCVIDRVPRRLTAEQTEELRRLAREVIRRLEVRRRSFSSGLAAGGPAEAPRRRPLAVAWSALTVVFLLFLAFQWVHVRVNRDLAQSTQFLARSHGVIEELDQVSSQLRAAEAAVRGFALSGEVEFFTAYRQARAPVEGLVESLSVQLGTTPAQRRRLEELASRVRAKVAVLEETLAARRGDGEEAAAAVSATRGREAMLRVDEVLEEIRAAERQEFAARHAESTASAARARTLLLAGTALSAGLLLVVFAVVRREILARNSSEQSLRDEKDFIAAVVKNANTLVVVLDREGRVLRFNRACERLSGVSAEEVKGRHYWEIFQPAERRTETAEWFASLRAADFPNRYEAEQLGRDGQRFLIEWANSAILDEDGELKSVVSCGTDLTDSRRAELALRESEERYRDLFENASDLVQSLGPDGRFAYVNRAWRETLGYSDLEARELSFLDIIEPSHHEECGQLFARIARGEDVGRIETVFVTRGGRPVRVEGSVSTRVEDGRLQATRGIFRDVTERHAQEEALRASEERTRTLVENLHEGLVIVRLEDARIVQVNPAAERMFGYRPGELEGRHLGELVPPEPGWEPGTFLRDAFPKAIGRISEWRGRRRDGSTFPFELAMASFRTADGEFVTGSLRDISERAEVDRIKREFVSTVSHELRTPLTSIRGSLGLVAGGTAGELPAAARELVDIAMRNSERLARLVDDILDIEKLDAGRLEFRLEPIDLGELARQAAAAVAGFAAQSEVRIETTIAGEGLRVMGDEGRLMQVFSNLLSNALKFSPQGGVVKLEVARRSNRVRTMVSDHGPGIPHEFQQRIFGRFQQADSSDTRKRGGTGLGLSISKAIVERLGGSIGFESEPGEGSRFHFELEALDARSEPAEPTAGRVLICEDDADLARLLGLLLGQAGLESTVARDAAAARRLLAESDFDAMTLDLVLPGESGIDLLRDLRTDPATAGLPVVVVSARAGEARDAPSGAGLQVADWIDKPIDPLRLLRSLRACVAAPPGERPAVLHVEDDADTRRLVEHAFGGDARVVSAGDLESARRRIAESRFDLVVLDLGLPDGSGLDLLPEIAALGVDAPPVVVFSASEPGPELARRVDGVLVKGRASHDDLVARVRSLVTARRTDPARAATSQAELSR